MKNLIVLFVLLLPIATFAQERAYLGVKSLHMSNKKAKALGFENKDGYYIARVMPNTPAETAGLQSFDYLYAVNGKAFTGDNDFHEAMDDLQAGETATFSLVRNGEKLEKTITLANRTHQNFPSRSSEEDPFLGVEANHGEKPKNMDGILVDVIDCSTAKDIGLKDDDLIVAVDDIKMMDWNDLHYAIDNRAVGDPINVTYYRDGQLVKVSQPIKSLAATRACEEKMREEASTPTLAVQEIAPLPTTAEVTIAMENVTEAEAEVMKEEKGIDMPIVNNLSIEALQLYPNPTSGIFELRFDLPQAGITTVRLFDSNAQLVYNRQLGQFTGNFQEQLDISNRARGIYFLEIRQNDLSISKKVILQ